MARFANQADYQSQFDAIQKSMNDLGGPYSGNAGYANLANMAQKMTADWNKQNASPANAAPAPAALTKTSPSAPAQPAPYQPDYMKAAGGMQAVNYIPPAPTVQRYDPITHEVQSNETVQGQMNSLLADNSPYLQQARARAAMVANGRGLLNSAMAVQGGEEAAISQAMPIASADAATYGRQALANQQYANQFLDKYAGQNYAMQGAGYNSQLSKDQAALDNLFKKQQIDQQGGYQIQVANIGAGASLRAAEMNLEGDKLRIAAQQKESQLDRDWKATQAEKDKIYGKEMKNLDLDSVQRNNLLQMNITAQTNYQDSWTKIQSSTTMTPEQKSDAIVALNNQFNHSQQLNNSIAQNLYSGIPPKVFGDIAKILDKDKLDYQAGIDANTQANLTESQKQQQWRANEDAFQAAYNNGQRPNGGYGPPTEYVGLSLAEARAKWNRDHPDQKVF